MTARLKPLWRGLAVTFITAMVSLYHLGGRNYDIPSEAMLPTLLVGDVLFCSGFVSGTTSAHNWTLLNPGGYAPYVEATLERGDLAIFRLPHDPSIDYVKRIVGIPGDRIRMVAGVLHINGDAVAREQVADFTGADQSGRPRKIAQFRETLPNGKRFLTLDITPNGELDNTPEYTVPPGHYFALGDNRDNSVDSRLGQARRGVGFIPAANFVCRPKLIEYSLSERVGLRFWRLPETLRFGRVGLSLQ